MPSADRPPPIPIHAGLAALAERYDHFIVDLWGVLHNGARPYAGALDALRALRRRGKRVAILSNAPRRSAEVARGSARIGITPDLYDHLVSSGEDAWQALRWRSDPWYAELGRTAYCMMAVRDRGMLDGLGLREVASTEAADFIFNTGVERNQDSVERFETALAAGVAADVPMVCANPDLVVIRDGVREICAGTLAARYEELGGHVRYHGKPFPSVYRTCFALLGVEDSRRALGVGDSLRTDIAGAAAAGIDSLLVTGGVHADELGFVPGEPPDPELLAAACERAGRRPTAAIPAFRW